MITSIKLDNKTNVYPYTKSVSFGSKTTDIAKLAELACDEINLAEKKLKISGSVKPPVEKIETLSDAQNIIAQRLEQFTKNINKFIYHDALTNLLNKRAYLRDRAVLTKASLRGKEKFGLIGLDLDNFKSYNDNFGHPEGDVALKFFAGAVKKAVGKNGKVYRVGGEELSVLIKESDYNKLSEIAKKIRETVEKESIKKYSGGKLKRPLTVSGGFHVFNPLEQEPLEKIVDKSLYVAKAKGRNKMVGINDIPVQLSLF